MKFWLAKVVLHAPTGVAANYNNLTDKSQQNVLAKIISGDYGSMPDGTIIEPVAEFASQLVADAAQVEASKRDPAGDYRVVGVL